MPPAACRASLGPSRTAKTRRRGRTIRASRTRKPEIGRVLAKRFAVKCRRRNANHRERFPRHQKIGSNHSRIAAIAASPRAIAHHRNRRRTAKLVTRAEKIAGRRSNPEQLEIVARNVLGNERLRQLGSPSAPDTLRFKRRAGKPPCWQSPACRRARSCTGRKRTERNPGPPGNRSSRSSCRLRPSGTTRPAGSRAKY